MKITPQILRTSANAMDAHLQGKPVETRSPGFPEWRIIEKPNWQITECEYRPAPTPPELVTRPWSKPDDVPGPVCWIRYRGQGVFYSCALTVGIDGQGLWTFEQDAEDSYLKWKDLENYEYSTDRKTWHKCEVAEEPK